VELDAEDAIAQVPEACPRVGAKGLRSIAHIVKEEKAGPGGNGKLL
jgi:hypothetical protein